MNTRPARPPRNPRSKRGSAMVTVMLIVVVSMLATASLFAFSSSTVHRVRLLTESIRAKAIAEAGANRGYNSLCKDYYTLRESDSLYADISFGGGSYSVSLESMSNGWTRLISVGSFGRAEHRVGLDMRDSLFGSSSTPDYLDYALFCNGAMTLNGTPKGIDGDLHSNGSFGLNGTYDNVNGLISAPPPNDIPVANQAVWSSKPFPLLTDTSFQEFLAKAEAAGVTVTRYSGNQTFKKDHVFDGITIIDGSATFIGSGTRSITGLFYVSGSLTANGSTELSGAIMTGGSCTINGASALLNHGDIDGVEAEDPNIVAEIWWD